eukprot:GEMP01054338.1.p1 GENE.GEMP01054338.1~~GEMP01054338.1.p1  ORF type:complete len:243 (+),score=44.66 GEMP01054338.1:166-894(+)
MLILETAQAGLSWATILKKRENFRAAYDNFDVLRVAKYGDADMNRLLLNEGIIRNRRKIEASIHNAKIVLDIQKKWTSFSRFLWSFVDGQPVVNRWDDMKDVPATTALSDKVSKELKRIGMKFIGSTTVYAYLQACGMVNDHLISCRQHPAFPKLNTHSSRVRKSDALRTVIVKGTKLTKASASPKKMASKPAHSIRDERTQKTLCRTTRLKNAPMPRTRASPTKTTTTAVRKNTKKLKKRE